MPLRDHFHEPLKSARHWQGFHNTWAANIAMALNLRLPGRYVAEPNVKYGIEIDVATPLALITDVVEVLVNYDEGGAVLVGAIEFVSPTNKDRPEQRDAFVAKCKSYVQAGVGLVVVDVVTERSANLHAELLGTLESTANTGIYAAAYHPVDRQETVQLEVWYEPLGVGKSLPLLPLWLHGGPCIPLYLEAIYEETCRGLRIP